MPSVSAKTEKAALLEAADPVKQLSITLEKKVRNLEKRKLKLDNYKNDVLNGKELNDDQKIAVSKYDQVIEVLEYSKDLYKSLMSISQESLRMQKKLAKKEQIERQQHDIQRYQETLYYRHILSSLETENIRNDFLTGENGGLKMSEDDLHYLSQFYKLIGSDLPNDKADLEGHFHGLSENMIFLLDGKNKDVAGTTYKALKELLMGIKESGYFSRTSEPVEEVSSDEIPESEDNCVDVQISAEDGTSNPHLDLEPVSAEVCEAEVIPEAEELEVVETHNNSESPELESNPETNTFALQNGSLQEVLASQGSFNFLQESQIELDTPHMDPAVVAVHQIAPPAGMNFSVAQYQVQPVAEEMHEPIPNGIDHDDVAPLPSQIPMMTNVVPRSLTSVQHNGSPDFDPSHPIPTQTFTNQSYAIMQNMMVPTGAYVPVTVHHGPLTPHIAPIPVVPGLSPTVTSASSVPIHVTIATIPVTTESSPITTGVERMSQKNEVDIEESALNGNACPETVSSQNDLPSERSNEGEDFVPHYNRPFRGRGRGRGQMNGYYRGRGNYNGGRGGYQGHNGYSQGGNFRRGPYRGRGNNNMRSGRGSNYTNNRSTHQQSQQQQQQQ